MDRTPIGQITPHMAQKRADTKQVFLLSLLHYVVVYRRSCSCGLIVTQSVQVKRWGGGYEQLKQRFMTLSVGFYCPFFEFLESAAPTFLKFILEGVLPKSIDFYRYVPYSYLNLAVHDS